MGQGTHKELLATNEVYQEIAYSQLSKGGIGTWKIKKVLVWKQCKPYMAGLQLPLLIAVVAAVISSIITVYGPTKIKEITNLISDGLATEIDLVAVSNIAGFLVVLYVFGAILNYTQAYIFSTSIQHFFKTLADSNR